MNSIEQFEAEYYRHYDAIYNYLYFRLGRDEHMAEEMLQEIFVKA